MERAVKVNQFRWMGHTGDGLNYCSHACDQCKQTFLD